MFHPPRRLLVLLLTPCLHRPLKILRPHQSRGVVLVTWIAQRVRRHAIPPLQLLLIHESPPSSPATCTLAEALADVVDPGSEGLDPGSAPARSPSPVLEAAPPSDPQIPDTVFGRTQFGWYKPTGKSYRSNVWSHFQLRFVEEGKTNAKCDHCDRVFVYSGSTSTLNRHLNSKHPIKDSRFCIAA